METIGADSSRVARATTHPDPASATWLSEVGVGSIEIPGFWGGGQGICPGSLGCGVWGLFSSIFFSTSLDKKINLT